MNVVIISGRLTKKPELRSSTKTSVCQFNLAVDNGKIDENGKHGADFIECVCFGKTAENLVKYQDKGSMIELKGRIQVDKYTNNEGKNTFRTLVYVETINYIGKPQTSENGANMGQKEASNNPYQEMGDRVANDLPF